MNQSFQRWSLFLLLPLYAVSLVAGAETEVLRIPWSHTTLITWDLFQGTPPPRAIELSEAAAIHTSIRWQYSYSTSRSPDNSYTCVTTAIAISHTMQPALSWALSGNTSQDLLRHEQLHFDLSEAYAHKLELLLQQIPPTKAATSEEASASHQEAFYQTGQTLLLNLREIVGLYDQQTDHSRDLAEQDRWELLIEEWLADPLSAP